MVPGHHIEQEVLLPGCHLQRGHRGNDSGRDQRPDESTQRGIVIIQIKLKIPNTEHICVSVLYSAAANTDLCKGGKHKAAKW